MCGSKIGRYDEVTSVPGFFNKPVIMKFLGKSLQLVGLILLPVAMTLELTGALGRDSGLADMLLMLVFGAAAFTLGRYIEGYAAGPKGE